MDWSLIFIKDWMHNAPTLDRGLFFIRRCLWKIKSVLILISTDSLNRFISFYIFFQKTLDLNFLKLPTYVLNISCTQIEQGKICLKADRGMC